MKRLKNPQPMGCLFGSGLVKARDSWHGFRNVYRSSHTRGHVAGARSKDSAVLVYACAYDVCCRHSGQAGGNKTDISLFLCGNGDNLQEQCTR